METAAAWGTSVLARYRASLQDLEPFNPMTEPQAPEPGDILIVIHEFQARSPDELSLSRDNQIEFIEGDDEFGDGWFLGRNIETGNSGLFPKGMASIRSSEATESHSAHPNAPASLSTSPCTSNANVDYTRLTARPATRPATPPTALPTALPTAWPAALPAALRTTQPAPTANLLELIENSIEDLSHHSDTSSGAPQSQNSNAGGIHDRDEDAKRISHLWGREHRVLGPSDVNPFEVCAYLGQGTVGAVEEVSIPSESSKTFVRKKILLPRAQRNERLKLVQEEVDILKSLTHIHIVRCIGTYEDATQVKRPASYCLLMLPVGNGDLKAFLDDTPRELIIERTTRLIWLQKWFVCLSSALKYMHSQGVRHQDIKPSNIVFRGNSIYLTDFSSSSRFVVGQTTSTESPFRCTAMYAAPEVASKYLEDGTLQKHGRGSDIFALGCVFCEMLTVLSGSLVSTFHEYLNSDGGRSEAKNGSLLYSRKLTLIEDWFQKLGRDGLPFTHIYSPCIKPMLRNIPVIRCTAATAQRNFKDQVELQKNAVECSCENG